MKREGFNAGKREFIKKCAALSAGMVCLPYSGFAGGTGGIEKKAGMKEGNVPGGDARGIMCRICPNECVLKEGEISKCNNRKVISQSYILWHLAIHAL